MRIELTYVLHVLKWLDKIYICESIVENRVTTSHIFPHDKNKGTYYKCYVQFYVAAGAGGRLGRQGTPGDGRCTALYELCMICCCAIYPRSYPGKERNRDCVHCHLCEITRETVVYCCWKFNKIATLIYEVCRCLGFFWYWIILFHEYWFVIFIRMDTGEFKLIRIRMLKLTTITLVFYYRNSLS